MPDHKLGPDRSFGKQYRLTRRADFDRLQKKGRKLYSKHFLLVVDHSPTGLSRVAIAVTKKVEPHATARNRLRRRLKELFRLARAGFLKPFDILIVARNNALSCEFDEIRREVLGALRHGGILGDSPQNAPES